MDKPCIPEMEAGFPATDWSEVRRAGDAAGGEVQRDALGRLWARYLTGLRAHLHARFGLVDGELDDALASFAVDKVLTANTLHHADRARLHAYLAGRGVGAPVRHAA